MNGLNVLNTNTSPLDNDKAAGAEFFFLFQESAVKCIVLFTLQPFLGRTQHDWLGRMSPPTLLFLPALTCLLSISDPSYYTHCQRAVLR